MKLFFSSEKWVVARPTVKFLYISDDFKVCLLHLKIGEFLNLDVKNSWFSAVVAAVVIIQSHANSNRFLQTHRFEQTSTYSHKFAQVHTHLGKFVQSCAFSYKFGKYHADLCTVSHRTSQTGKRRSYGRQVVSVLELTDQLKYSKLLKFKLSVREARREED